jgi:hypothetical protein
MSTKPSFKLREFGKFVYNRWLVPLLKPGRYVYFIAVEKPIWYNKDKSKIVYIGKTEKHAHEALFSMAQQIVYTIPQRLRKRRFGNHVSIHFIELNAAIQPKEIETALLYAFHARYGDIPKCNTQGKWLTHKHIDVIKRKYSLTLDDLIKTLDQIDKI